MYSVNSWKKASFHSYGQAKNYWEKTKPWRGRADQNSRPVGTRRQVDTTIRQDGEDYVVRYHQTDIVRFRPNGSLTFQAYPSLSTNALARRFTPSGVTVDYRSDGYFVGLIVNDKWTMHKVEKVFTLHRQADGSWMIEGTLPLIRTSVDRTAANAVYKEAGYRDFAAFMRAAEKLDPPENLPDWQRYRQRWSRFVQQHQIIEYFEQGLDGWHALAEKLPRPTQALEIVREHLVKKHRCIEQVEVECTSWGNLRSIAASSNKWR